jgi:hypothetical protein
MQVPRGQYVIQDPYHGYAVACMRSLYRRYGFRAVTFYTNPDDYRMNRYRYPELSSSELVAEEYGVDLNNLDPFITELRQRHDIRAVVPYNELQVAPAEKIAEGLGLSWAQPEVMFLFRNKLLLKQAVSAADPKLRMNVVRLVHSPEEALATARDHDCKRFVLKPNDGFGNVDVGIFDTSVESHHVIEFWRKVGRSQMLFEEFIGGEEYHCDGVIDSEGIATATNAFRYLRGPVNGRENIELGSELILENTKVFADLAEYAQRVITASGLRRSPFHCEIKVDEQGPCLIECSARPVGQMTVPVVHLAHGGDFDFFDVITHYYVEDTNFGDLRLNWQAYNARLLRQVCGVVESQERIYTLSGLREVEEMPAFLRWLKPVEISQRVRPTRDIFGSAYIGLFQGSSTTSLDELAETVRSTIQWNQRVRPVDRVRAGTMLGVRRFKQRPRRIDRLWRHTPR